MTFKINISEKSGKTYKLETESEALIGRELHSKINGKDVSPELEGYEFEITGASDKAGLPSFEEVEGVGLRKILLGYGKGMKKRPRKEGKKKRSDYTPSGLRLRKTVRGRVISENIIQINLKILKEGAKKLSEIFSDQTEKELKLNRKERRKNKPKAEEKPEEKPAEEIPEQPSEENSETKEPETSE